MGDYMIKKGIYNNYNNNFELKNKKETKDTAKGVSTFLGKNTKTNINYQNSGSSKASKTISVVKKSNVETYDLEDFAKTANEVKQKYSELNQKAKNIFSNSSEKIFNKLKQYTTTRLDNNYTTNYDSVNLQAIVLSSSALNTTEKNQLSVSNDKNPLVGKKTTNGLNGEKIVYKTKSTSKDGLTIYFNDKNERVKTVYPDGEIRIYSSGTIDNYNVKYDEVYMYSNGVISYVKNSDSITGSSEKIYTLTNDGSLICSNKYLYNTKDAVVYRTDGTSEIYDNNILESRRISEKENITYHRNDDGSINFITIGNRILHDYQNIDCNKTMVDENGKIYFNASDGRKIFRIRNDGYLEFGDDAGYYTKTDNKGLIWIYDLNDNPILATNKDGIIAWSAIRYY